MLNPNERFSSALRRTATFYKQIREASLAASQFPSALTDPQGSIAKPDSW